MPKSRDQRKRKKEERRKHRKNKQKDRQPIEETTASKDIINHELEAYYQWEKGITSEVLADVLEGTEKPVIDDFIEKLVGVFEYDAKVQYSTSRIFGLSDIYFNPPSECRDSIARLIKDGRRDLKRDLKEYQIRASNLLEHLIYKKLDVLEDLEQRLEKACAKEHISQKIKEMPSYTVKEGEEVPEKRILVFPEDEEHTVKDLEGGISSVLYSLNLLSFGFAIDFLEHISRQANLSENLATLYLLEIGNLFDEKDIIEKTGDEKNIRIPFRLTVEGIDKEVRYEVLDYGRAVLVWPVEALPKKAKIGEVDRAFAKISPHKFSGACSQLFLTMRKNGFACGDIAEKIVRYSKTPHGLSNAQMILSVAKKDRFSFLVDILANNEYTLEMVSSLSNLGYEPRAVADFLVNLGDWEFEDKKTFPEIIVKLGKKVDAIKLIADNAEVFCLDEFSLPVFEAVINQEEGTRFLRAYLAYNKTNEFYKQRALLRYFKAGKEVKQVTDILDCRKNTEVGSLELRSLDAGRELAILTSDEKIPDIIDVEQKLSSHPGYQKLVSYRCIAQIIQQQGYEPLIDHITRTMDAVGNTYFFDILCSQKKLFRTYLKRLAKNPKQTIDSIASLKNSQGNPYEELPIALGIQQRIEQEKQEEVPVLEYNRIVIISYDIPPETIEYISQQTGKPVKPIELRIDLNPRKDNFKGISSDDLVLFLTSRADHRTYDLTKRAVDSKGARMLHSDSTNKYKLLQLIRDN